MMFSKSVLALGFAVMALPAMAADHAVTIQGFAFEPATLSLAVGDTVTFTNLDGAPHTATGDAFDTGTLKKGKSATVEITEAGDFSYKCNFHPSMAGTVSAK